MVIAAFYILFHFLTAVGLVVNIYIRLRQGARSSLQKPSIYEAIKNLDWLRTFNWFNTNDFHLNAILI